MGKRTWMVSVILFVLFLLVGRYGPSMDDTLYFWTHGYSRITFQNHHYIDPVVWHPNETGLTPTGQRFEGLEIYKDATRAYVAIPHQIYVRREDGTIVEYQLSK